MKEYPRKYMQDFTCFLKRNYLEISFFQDEFYACKTWCQSKYEFHVKSEAHTTPRRKIINTELERYECNFNNRQLPGDMRTVMSNLTQICTLTSKMLLLNPTTKGVTVPKGQRLGLYSLNNPTQTMLM